MSRIQHTPSTATPTPDLAAPMSTDAAPETTAPTNAVEVRLTSAQLKERLDETRAAAERRVLAELGVDDLGKAKELLSKAAPRTDEKWQSLEATAAEQAAKLSEMESLLQAMTNERAVSTLAGLPDQARKAIEDATDDAEERIALAQVFLAAGVSPAAPVAPTQASVVSQPVTAQSVVQASVSTAPPRTAPVDASASMPNRKEEYDRLKRDNPIAAAHYLSRFSREIFPG